MLYPRQDANSSAGVTDHAEDNGRTAPAGKEEGDDEEDVFFSIQDADSSAGMTDHADDNGRTAPAGKDAYDARNEEEGDDEADGHHDDDSEEEHEQNDEDDIVEQTDDSDGSEEEDDDEDDPDYDGDGASVVDKKAAVHDIDSEDNPVALDPVPSMRRSRRPPDRLSPSHSVSPKVRSMASVHACMQVAS